MTRAPVGYFTHGRSGYQNYKCRCRICRSAWADYNRRRRAERALAIAADPSIAEHGTVSTNKNYGCNCGPCRDAHAANERARRRSAS